ncbi:hypothetical protein ACFQZQ_08905 [Lysobacter koreensis]|uniref:Lipoprotein n=1 Tax=Lysobacter koreensis TaxID=266122 RepID=A0ABW2YM19_9GAMM
MRVVLPLLYTALLGACSCQRAPDAVAAAAGTGVHSPTPADAVRSNEAAAETARADQIQGQRARRIGDAVDALHSYLRKLGSGQHDAAAQHWAYQRSPSVDEEAGLRALGELQSLRIQNGTPNPLDAEAVPNYLEIPVELQAALETGQGYRYRGWYRLRYNPVTTHWEMTAASLSPVIR